MRFPLITSAVVAMAMTCLLSFCSPADRTVPKCQNTRDLNASLQELIPEMSWGEWYGATSGYAPNPEYFGAYVTLPVGKVLYIGLGTGLPSLGDGALVARFDGQDTTVIGSLTEEGVHEMIWDDHAGTLHIAGTDPSWPEDWSAGNHYTYRPSERKIHKYRDPVNGLVNVIHSWGLWMSADDVLYAAVNSHDGSFTRDRNLLRRLYNRINYSWDDSYYSKDYGVTRRGQILTSTDHGATWRQKSDLGYFRAYDVLGQGKKLYAIYTDTPDSPCTIAVSDDDRTKWRDISQRDAQRTHLISFRDEVLASSLDGESIYALNGDTLSVRRLPEGFRLEFQFNVLAVGGGCLYALCNREKSGAYSILRTTDLRQWEEIACTDQKLISLSYWEDRNWLILSGTGAAAKLWKIDLNELPRTRLSGSSRSLPDTISQFQVEAPRNRSG